MTRIARQIVRESKNATAEIVDQRINRNRLEGANSPPSHCSTGPTTKPQSTTPPTPDHLGQDLGILPVHAQQHGHHRCHRADGDISFASIDQYRTDASSALITTGEGRGDVADRYTDRRLT